MAAKSTDTDGGIGGFFRSVPEFVQQVRAETAKVAWPTRRETLMTAAMVVVMTTMLGLFFLGIDQIFSHITQFLLSLIG